MPRISNFVEKLETRISNKLGKFTSRHKGNFIKYIPLIIIAWYFYGMFVNSIRLGIQSTFNTTGDEIGSVWVANPLRNFTAIFTPAGLTVTAICVLLTCLILKKGYIFFSGYKFTKDPRGFDILPDATHGSSGFMTLKEMHATLNIEDIETADDTIIGKRKEHPGDEDKYAQYLTVRKDIGLTDHTLVFGATGAGKSRGYVLPFILQAAKRGDSIIIVDPKAEIYKKTSEHLRQNGYTVKVFNLLDPENTDGWNCFADIELDPGLVDSIAEVIIKNTSNESERRDFWENAERSLLQALMHFVASQKIPGTDRLLPIEQRSLGAIYRMLSDESFDNLNRYIDDLPKGHPAKKPYGLFKKSDKRIWGNIAIGLGNRLSVFQNEQLDRLTSYNDIDLTLPGRKPCAYFCVISAQDSQYEFLSSLFFSCLSTRLTDYARRKGTNGMLPVRVNLLLEEFCNIGKLVDFKKQLAVLRGYNVFCQLIVQSVPGLADRYEKKEWEEIISHCDTTICLGVNDLMTAQYISDKCGTITIRVDNNQMPLMPLFSPIYHSTRPYSQTRSSTQRALMMPDEVLRMDNKKCIVILRGQKPLMLDKITPEEFPVHSQLKLTIITDYFPTWHKKATAPASYESPLYDGTFGQTSFEAEPAQQPENLRQQNHAQITIPMPGDEPNDIPPAISALPNMSYLEMYEACHKPGSTEDPCALSSDAAPNANPAPGSQTVYGKFKPAKIDDIKDRGKITTAHNSD